MDQIFSVNSASFQDFEVSSSLRAGPGIMVDFTQATIVTGSFSGRGDKLVSVTASYILPTQNTSASYATTSGTAHAIDFLPVAASSASWVSSSAKITTSDTASFVTASNISGKVSAATTADTASFVTASNVIGKVSTAVTANIATSASWASSSISSSYATTASVATTIAGTNNYVPVFISNNLSATSSIFADGQKIAIGSASFDSVTPGVMVVWANPLVDQNTIAEFYHITNSFAQVVIQNRIGGATASADLIMQGDSGSVQQVGYLDVGINNTGYNEPAFNIGGPLDSYVAAYASASVGGNLNLGCDTSGKQIQFTVGGFTTASQVMQISDTIYPNVQITGSLQVTTGITGSLKGTASYAQNVVNYVYGLVSGSNSTHTGDTVAVSTPLSFSINTGETWVCEAFITAQSNNNRGMRYAISSSGTSTFGNIEGQVIGNTNAVTALSSARITAANSIIATTLHSQANTPGFDRIHLSIQNPTATTTISIAIAVTNSADTATAFAGSYMIAEKVR